MAAEIPDGAVVVARAILNSSLWTMKHSDVRLAITCICIANWKDRKIWYDGKEMMIQRGQFVRSLSQLALASGLTLQELRTSIKRLFSTGFLTRQKMGQSYLYTLPKYNDYQDLSKYADREWPENFSKSTRFNYQQQQGINRASTELQQGSNNKQEWEEGEEVKKAMPLNGAAIKKAKEKITLFESESTRLTMMEYLGFLENVGTIPPERILQFTDVLWNLRESIKMNDNVPVDKIFCYAVKETIEHKATRPSYVGKVIQNAILKWREGVLKF